MGMGSVRAVTLSLVLIFMFYIADWEPAQQKPTKGCHSSKHTCQQERRNWIHGQLFWEMKITRTIRCTFVFVCVCVLQWSWTWHVFTLFVEEAAFWQALTQKKFVPFAGDKETQMVTCHADSKVGDSKLASLFLYFCVTYEILVTAFVKNWRKM